MLSRALYTQLTAVLLAFVAAGFALLLGELLMIGHTNQTQMVAVGAAAIGLVLSLLAFVPRPGLRRAVTVLFVVLALVGLFGVYIHLNGRTRRQVQLESVQPPDDRVMRRALNSFARNPPLVPPLALSGLAALGVVTLLTAGAEVSETPLKRRGLAAASE